MAAIDDVPNLGAPDLPTLCPAFHHVNLRTNRLQEMVDWYGLVVGSWPTFQANTFAFLTNDGANHRIALTALREYEEPAQRDGQIGLAHTAFEYRTVDELLLTWRRLTRQDIWPATCLDHGPTTSFYYVDPDGHRVELQADNWDNSSQSAAWMRDDEQFAADPIGKPVDPARLIAARAAGLSPWEIHVRAYRGEYAPDA